MKNKKLPLLFAVMMFVSLSFYVLMNVMAEKKTISDNGHLGMVIAGFVLLTSFGILLLLRFKRR